MRSASDDGTSRPRATSLSSFFGIRRTELRGLTGGIAFLAVLELLVGGFLLPAIRQPFEGEAIVYWTSVVATFARNLSAILGVGVATLYVGSFVRDKTFARPTRRMTIAMLAVLAIPVQALALLVQVTPEMVFMSYTATFFSCALMVATAVQWPGPIGPRVGLVVALLPPTASFLGTVIGRLSQGGGGFRLGLFVLRTFDLGGEGLVLLVSLLAPLLFLRPAARSLLRPPGLVAGILALLPSTAFVAVRIFGGDRVPELTQATMGLELAFWKPLYLAALFAFATAVLANLLPSSHPERRGVPEIGLGLVLVAAAGQDSHTPFQLLLLLLGFQQLAGGVLELREPGGS